MQNKVLIIDGNNLLHRVYWTTIKNIPNYNKTTHISLFLTALKSYVELFNPYKIIVCWDYRENSTDNFRKTLDENYKANRNEEQQNDVYACMPILNKLLDTLGVSQINPLALEADDIMFWLATVKYPNQSVIITSDTDMYQLISNSLPGNIIYNPNKKREISLLFLKENFNVNTGLEFIIQKAIRGDKSDNLIGIKGIRQTKIQQILSILSVTFDIDSLVSAKLLNENEVTIFKHNLKMMMFSIDNISEEEINWYNDCLYKSCDSSKNEFALLIKELEFWNIYKKIDYWFNTFYRIDYTDVFTAFFNDTH